MLKLVLVFYSLIAFTTYANDCENAFQKFRYTRFLSELFVTEQNVEKRQKFFPSHKDPVLNLEKQKLWNAPSDYLTPPILQTMLPEGVNFINHSNAYAPYPYIVRLPFPGLSIIARAQYEYKGENLWTNVIFSRNALYDNINDLSSSKKWLVGTTAKAAILFLHGGGTRTATAANFTEEINHIAKLGFHGIAIDLPLHNNGSMDIKKIEEHALAIGEFTKKYIPPHVPLFIYGHSFGGVVTEKIMQMSADKDNPSFHSSLSGIITASPPIQDSSLMHTEGGVEAMLADYVERLNQARKQVQEMKLDDLPEGNVMQGLIEENKVSFVNGMYTSWALHDVDYNIPSHKGADYLPTLMLMGKYDQLVYLGFEDLFDNYYGNLSNVKSVYFDKEPLYESKQSKDKKQVGHLLAFYKKEGTHTPLHLHEIIDFMLKILNNKIEKDSPEKNLLTVESLENSYRSSSNRFNLSIVEMAQLWSNDLAFRNWYEHFYVKHSIKNGTAVEKYINRKKEIRNDIVKALIKSENRMEKTKWIEAFSNLVSLKKHIDDINFVEVRNRETLYEALLKIFPLKPTEEKLFESLEGAHNLEDFIILYSRNFSLKEDQQDILSSVLVQMREKNSEITHIRVLRSLTDASLFTELFLLPKYGQKNQFLDILSRSTHISDTEILDEMRDQSVGVEDLMTRWYPEFIKLSDENKDTLEDIFLIKNRTLSKKEGGILNKALLKANSLENFIEIYPKSQIDIELAREISPFVTEYLKISAIEEESYIPLLQEFFEHKGITNDAEKEKRTEEFTKDVIVLAKIVEEIEEIKEKKTILEKETSGLQKSAKKRITTVLQSISTVRKEFEKIKYHPSRLQEKYFKGMMKKDVKELKVALEEVNGNLPMLEKKLNAFFNKSEMLVKNFLESEEPINTKRFSEKIQTEELSQLDKDFQSSLSSHREKVKETQEKFWVLKLKDDSDSEVQKAFKNVYSSDGELAKFKSETEAWAEKEAQKIQYETELAGLREDYSRISPISIPFYTMDIDKDSMGGNDLVKQPKDKIKAEIEKKNRITEEFLNYWKKSPKSTPNPPF